MWLNFSVNSKYKAYAYWLLYIKPKGWNTLSWVLGLIQYKNNNLNNVIGILSDLYWTLIKYVNKIINPLNGNFGYKKWILNTNLLKIKDKIKWYYNFIKLFDIKFYIWTSKIMDPSERYTPYIERILVKNYKVVYKNEFFNIVKNTLNNPNPAQWAGLGLLFIFKPRNPIFNNLSFNFVTFFCEACKWKDGTIKIFPCMKRNIYATHKNFWSRMQSMLGIKILQCILKVSKSLLIKISDLNYAGVNFILYNSFSKKLKLVPNHSLVMNKSLHSKQDKEIYQVLKYKSLDLLRVFRINVNNLPSKLEGKFNLPMRFNRKIKRMVININKMKDKITEKNKTKSRSNKWKFIISEKSRKHIILGCEGKTYLEKLQNFYNTWWNYYIIRECNSGKILYEYHSPIKKNENWERYSPFNPPFHIFPAKIKKFLNCSNVFINSNLENKITIINDIKLDKFTELNSYYRNTQKKEMNYFNIIKTWREGMEHRGLNYTESNIEQYYSFFNNNNVYVGWVSIIRIRNYSSQPTYYNNLIKRYHKDWLFILKELVGIPNDNMKCNSNTKMNNTNTSSSLIINEEEVYFSASQDLEKTSIITRVWSNLKNNHNQFEPIIPTKYKKIFDTEIITIKKFKPDDCEQIHGHSLIRKRNKLPWRLKEYMGKKEDLFIKGFVKISAKYR
jgi:hypothetical protein